MIAWCSTTNVRFEEIVIVEISQNKKLILPQDKVMIDC